MPRPIRILVWGPGGIGRTVIREVAARSDFEIVGARAFSEDKDGVDVGTIAGIDPIGVTATTDDNAVLPTECDVVVHASRDFGNYNSLDEIVQLLEAGHNVITVHAYNIPDAMEGTAAPADARARIEQACQNGQSTFHATGIHPGFVANRITGILTGLSSEIDSIHISENWDVSHISREQIEPLGIGATPEDAAEMPTAAALAHNYAWMNLHSVAKALGVQYTRTESSHEPVAATTEITGLSNGIDLKPGQVGRITHLYIGHVDDLPRPMTVTLEVNWMQGRGPMRPDHIATDDYYIVTIEGRPSLRLSLDIQGSFATGEHLVIPGDPTSEPGYHATVVSVLQHIPQVVAAAPGWLEMTNPVPHWAPSFHDSWNN